MTKKHPWAENPPVNNPEEFLAFMMFMDQARYIQGLNAFDDEDDCFGIVAKLKEIFEIASSEDAKKLTYAAMKAHAKAREEAKL
jgi:hypothetical protein